MENGINKYYFGYGVPEDNTPGKPTCPRFVASKAKDRFECEHGFVAVANISRDGRDVIFKAQNRGGSEYHDGMVIKKQVGGFSLNSVGKGFIMGTTKAGLSNSVILADLKGVGNWYIREYGTANYLPTEWIGRVNGNKEDRLLVIAEGSGHGIFLCTDGKFAWYPIMGGSIWSNLRRGKYIQFVTSEGQVGIVVADKGAAVPGSNGEMYSNLFLGRRIGVSFDTGKPRYIQDTDKCTEEIYDAISGTKFIRGALKMGHFDKRSFAKFKRVKQGK
jgi:hypothetical protein